MKWKPVLQAASLGVLTAVATIALAWSDAVTKPIIESERRADFQRVISQVMPESLYDNSPLDTPIDLSEGGSSVRYFVGRKDGRTTSVAFESESVGYSGPVELLVAVDPAGTILGVRVTAHSETPGLGDKIEIEKSDWILGFNGKNLENPPLRRWAVRKDGGDFDALTGATITPRAVVKGVRLGLERFEQDKDELLSRVPTAKREEPKR